MITTTILLIVSGFLSLLIKLFSLVSIAIPDAIEGAFGLMFSYIHVFDGVLPVTDVLAALLLIISIQAAMYIIKIALMGYALLPWFGRKTDLPKHERHDRNSRR